MSAVLIWPVFSNVARALFSNGLVIGERAQNSLVRPLVHPSRLDQHRTVGATSKPCAQFFYLTSRAIPPVPHGGLISNPRALAAIEKPDALRKVPSVKNARGTTTLRAQKHQVAAAIMCRSPIAADSLAHRLQPLAACRPYGKFQNEPLRIRTAGDLKPNGSEQPTALAECQLPVSGEFMNIKPCTLHIAELSLVFAALRLITRSNLVGCTTGSSPGLIPLSIFPA
jgi:hypothetical protein